jgi:hypothetical protein
MKFKELDTVVLAMVCGTGIWALSWAPMIRTDSMWSL